MHKLILVICIFINKRINALIDNQFSDKEDFVVDYSSEERVSGQRKFLLDLEELM